MNNLIMLKFYKLMTVVHFILTIFHSFRQNSQMIIAQTKLYYIILMDIILLQIRVFIFFSVVFISITNINNINTLIKECLLQPLIKRFNQLIIFFTFKFFLPMVSLFIYFILYFIIILYLKVLRFILLLIVYSIFQQIKLVILNIKSFLLLF